MNATPPATAAQRAAAFVPELQQQALDYERTGVVAPAMIKRLRQANLLNLLSPATHQGLQTSFSDVFEATRVLAQGCMSTAWVVTVGNMHNWLAANYPEAAQAEYFAQPEVFAAASFAPTGRATMTEAGFIATGRWHFLSGVDHAQWVFVSALTKTSIDQRPRSPWFLLVPKSAVEVDHSSWAVSGLRATGSKDVILKDCFVPAHRAVFLPQLMGDHPVYHPHPLFARPTQAALVAVLAAPILGAAQAAVREFARYTADRVVKMTGARQADQAPAQIILAQVSAQVDIVQTALEKIFIRLDSDAQHNSDDLLKLSRDVAFCVRQLNDAVQEVMRHSGGGALQQTNPIQRIWRDVAAASNHAALNWPTQAQAWGQAALSAQRQ